MTEHSHRLPIVFILITLVLDAIGIGLILPVMPDLIRDIEGAGLSDAAIWGGVLATVFAVMQFLCGPLVGNLSDRFGRRPVLLISLATMALDYVVMALAGSIWLLLAARVIGGVTASTQATASAFLADISRPEQKAARFGMVGASFGIGFVIGPVIGGFLGEFGPRAPFWAAAGLAGVNFLFGLLVLPETVTERTRRRFDLRRANPLGAFREMRRLPGVAPLLVLFFLYEFAMFIYPAIWAYFTQYRFGWSPGTVGISLAMFGIGVAAVQGGLIRVILRALGERFTVWYGLGYNLLAFLLIGVIESGRAILLLTPLIALGAVVTPALLAMMSRAAGDNQQGEVQGTVSSLRSVAMILSPLVMTQLFAAFTSPQAKVHLPGAPFFLAAGVMGICGLVFAYGGRLKPPGKTHRCPESAESR
ncbi:DHA1 family tetracycline resistance protein-like MFS transporter [Rhodovulum imhoffii]|uniref:DHA1 family tetracycline resistance protein-like MFS transporter n=1 Tax=Rhodovulum imhoffii TaxID=365340 RepID=A0A2T5BRD2_9RHOB|nr:TCR/Tet family MFS transporter [Rhodovulum imhoffii]MBK5934444.1 tetracycline resistance MFS efflux pump [Rhodovulum imhoffii]PTN01791.1 DHA1 family tetracycline resistance protein-like MFS transporter [Rhodovulum imhoffii]